MDKKKLILIGGGGHCKSCIDTIVSVKEFEIAGILDIKEKVGESILGFKIIGTDEDLHRFPANDYYFLITIGQIQNAGLRKGIYEKLKSTKCRLATIISASAIVSKYSTVGEGTVVLHGAKINAASNIGENCIINTNANIEHDCKIGRHVHISTNVVVNGGCVVYDECFIGSNSVLINGITVAASSVIGAGAVVNRTLIEPGVYVGNPCRKIEK
ncbi:sugar O-acyltransferase, sialic acid O-acetyltransferase NeuD family [Chitinophaga rupis]|uniref:Sugar O-acyltransferase, sialic acid O-acetyltransferase NeuD family n=1 Tax=Chitinophaga rupis TaxID=573321 RepID=A0A1H7LMG0_9BACT|nr:acetyltransferase [Chitinophaga rupis]SEL00143.1 sugar O-acyltransferase, sialic acid O-acetyltransferase NeuD family [Chitinophaga rupis]